MSPFLNKNTNPYTNSSEDDTSSTHEDFESRSHIPPILKNAQINVSKLIRGLGSGNYNSLFKNQGIEYSESNPYNYGDDSRYIDWNLSSRMNALHTKYFHEERSRVVWFMFDCSSSMNIGAPLSVYDIAMETALTLGSLALSLKDKVGAMIFDTKVRHYIPPSHLLQSIQRLCNDIEKARFSTQSADLGNAVHFSRKILFQRSLIIVISDFLIDNCFEHLSTLANAHDVLAVRVYYDIQANFPGGISMKALDSEENTSTLISSNVVKKRYIENQSQLKHVWQRFKFKKESAYCEIATTDSVFQSLAYFLRKKTKI